MGSVTVAVALAAADSSVVVLALPDLYATFDTSIVGISWTITAYNLAIVVGALAVLPLEPRVRGHVIAGTGLAVFAAASLVCGLAGNFELLLVGRLIQGLGAAFALAGAVPVLRGIRGSARHAIGLWALAAVIGVAVGPALGGFLTEFFSWRSIFLLQAPLAAIALVAVADPRVRAVERLPRPERSTRIRRANLGFLLLYGALVGALFLAVLLLVVVWGWSPLTGALIVTALPAGTLAVRQFGSDGLSSGLAAATGGLALAGGLFALAFVPAASAAVVAVALGACGIGLGILGARLEPAAIPPSHASVRAATTSIAARHAGFVIGLALIAPILAADLDTGALEATRATTAEVLDSPVSLRTKIGLAIDMRDLVEEARRGDVPDAGAIFDELGAEDDRELRATRDGVTDAIRDTLTRGFRASFLIAALFGAAAALVVGFLIRQPAVASAQRAVVPAVVVMLAVALLLVAELAAGGRDFGARAYVEPCSAPADPFPQGEGIDGTLQRISLSAINGAACELGTGREELILSLERRSGFGPEVTWTTETLEAALRAGLVRAIDDADDRNTIPGLVASGLRFVAERAPIDWVLGRFDIPFLE